MNTLINADDGSQYESAESIRLMDISEELAAGQSEDHIIAAINLRFAIPWCNCAHDCCGHWRSSVESVMISGNRAMVYLYHSQNV